MLDEEITLHVRHVKKRFGKHIVLKDVSFDAVRSEVIGIVGENGSGKTTLLKILVGLLTPDSGEIHVRNQIAYCPQDPIVFDLLTLQENLLYFGTGHGLKERKIYEKSNKLMETLLNNMEQEFISTNEPFE